MITLTEFLLKEEKKYKEATGSFTLLLQLIQEASKIINSHVRKYGLAEIIGFTGTKNKYNEDVMGLDEYSNNLLITLLSSHPEVNYIASEELEKPIIVNKNGKYSVFLDPLDGSSNIDSNINIGTIFSIYNAQNGPLQKDKDLVSAGYILYGSSTMFVYTSGKGTHGFTLDPSIGSYILSHPEMKIPKKGKIYSINESYSLNMDKKIQDYLIRIKKKKYTLRYIACLVADMHRILCKGGVFAYPRDENHKNGKLRLYYEVYPMSFIIKQAGGKAYSDNIEISSIKPNNINQCVSIIIGSPDNVDEFIQIY